MLKNNTKYIKRNLLRRAQKQVSPNHSASPASLLKHDAEMEGSEEMLHVTRIQMANKAYSTIIKGLAKRYHMSSLNVCDMLHNIANFDDEQAHILMKMVRMEPVHLAKSDKPNHDDKNSSKKPSDNN